MNYVITVINPGSEDLLTTICAGLGIPIVTVLLGEGTADASIRSLFGIDYSRQKRIVAAIANEENTGKLLKAQKRFLDIDAPGHGMTAVIPVKSVGGKSTLAYLSGNREEPMKKPDIEKRHELILCIANSGATDMVMAAARKAGAHGGTVLHGKGTGNENTPRFFNVTISSEKEIIMILASSGKRNEIMQAVLREAGPSTDAGAIVFSLPVTAVAGIDDQLDEEEHE